MNEEPKNINEFYKYIAEELEKLSIEFEEKRRMLNKLTLYKLYLENIIKNQK